MNKIILTIIILVALTIPAMAESGTIEAHTDTEKSFTIPLAGGVNDIAWTKLHYDNSHYNKITKVNFTYSTLSFPLDADETTFTITSGGSGSGYVYYIGNKVTWLFTQDSTFLSTADTITLSYARNIFAGATQTPRHNGITCDDSTNIDQPVTLCDLAGTFVFVGTYYSLVGVSTTETYLVEYPIAGFFNVTVNKSSTTIGVLNHINGSSTNYYNEGSFNTNDFNFFGQYADGLYINMTLQGGGYNNVLINATGSAVQPTPTPTPPTPPLGGAAIAFDNDSYLNGETAFISWNFDSSIFNFLVDFNIKLKDAQGNIIQEWHNLPTISGNVQHTWTHTGVFTVDLVKSCFLLCNDEVLGTDSTIVVTTADQPLTNSITTSKSSYNTSESVYISGAFYPKTNEQTKGYVLVTAMGGGTVVNTFTIDTSNTNAFNFSSKYAVGSYTATLSGYLNTNDCAGTTGYPICYVNYGTANFIVVNSSAGLSINWITDGTLPNSTTKLNTFPIATWTNVTANDIVTIFDNNGLVSKQFYINNTGSYVCPSCYNSLAVQIPDEAKYIGVWQAQIQNGSNASNISTAYLNVISASSVNFTNDFGVSMYWDKSIGSVKDTRYLIWTTGTYTGNYQIKIIDGITGNFITAFSFTSTGTKTQQTAWTFSKAGDYAGQFIDSNNTILASAIIKITSGVATTVTPGAGGGGTTSGEQKANDIANLLDSNIFWALIFTVGLMIAVAIASRNRGEE